MTTENGWRSGDASEESGARTGDPRQIAPLPPGSELVESPHEVSVLELVRRDTGALMGLLVLVVLFLFAPGCAPPQRSAATPAPAWCEDCAGGGR